jgi:hypothetical protein
VVNTFEELQGHLDHAWTNNLQATICPPGIAYTEDKGLFAFSDSFPIQALFPDDPEPQDGVLLYPLTMVETTNTPTVRTWYAPVGVVTNTAPPSEYDATGWVLAKHTPPAYLSPERRSTWIEDWKLSGRQTLRCRLISTNDVPAFLSAITNRPPSTVVNVASNEIGAVSIRVLPGGDSTEIMLHVPPQVDRVGIYEKAALTPPGPWNLLGQIAHSTDPIVYHHPLSGQGKVLMFANHVQDHDADGLPDAWETLVFGTDPNWGDSDDDGIGDYAEAVTYRTNPNSLDSDGDGVMDSTEMRAGYDPGVAQTFTRFEVARLLGLPPMKLKVDAAYPSVYQMETLFDGPLTENGLNPGDAWLAPKQIAARAQMPAHNPEATYVSLENLASDEDTVSVLLRMYTHDPGNTHDPAQGGYCNPVEFSVEYGYFTEATGPLNAEYTTLLDPLAVPAPPNDDQLTIAVCMNKPTNVAVAAGTMEMEVTTALPDIALTPTNALACACNQEVTFTAEISRPYGLPEYQEEILWEIIPDSQPVYGPKFRIGTNYRTRMVTTGEVRSVVVRTGDVGGTFTVRATLSGDTNRMDQATLNLIKADLDVDTDRNGTVTDQPDELGEDSFNWNVGRGAWIAPHRDFGYSAFYANPAPTSGVVSLRIRPSVLAAPAGWSMRIKAADESTATHLKLYGEDLIHVAFTNNIISFASWPTNGLNWFAASKMTRKQDGPQPNQLVIDLETLDGNAEVRCTDRVVFKVVPVLLPPEYNAPEVIYSIQIDGEAGIEKLNQTGDSGVWLQDMVKFCKIQVEANDLRTSGVLLGHRLQGSVPAVLRYDMGIPGPSWAAEGDGGSMMATAPLPGAPFGKILLGNKQNISKPHWVAQGLQPVVDISTGWLEVGHVDEVLMWVATNKVLYASP